MTLIYTLFSQMSEIQQEKILKFQKLTRNIEEDRPFTKKPLLYNSNSLEIIQEKNEENEAKSSGRSIIISQDSKYSASLSAKESKHCQKVQICQYELF
jgi:hypothetical protein